jgi:hypothetical protein
MKSGMPFGGTGGLLWAFAGIKACTNLTHCARELLNFFTRRHPWRSRRVTEGEVLRLVLRCSLPQRVANADRACLAWRCPGNQGLVRDVSEPTVICVKQ